MKPPPSFRPSAMTDLPVQKRKKIVSSIRRDITLVLVLKVAIILLAAFTVFGSAQRVHVDADVMTHKLMG